MAAITTDFPVHAGDDLQYAADLDALGGVTVSFTAAAGSRGLPGLCPMQHYMEKLSYLYSG